MSGVVTLGESLGLVVARDVGGFDRQSSAEVTFGGAESNVAIGVARLGTPAAWIGRLGDDALGRRILRGLRAEGVRTHVVLDAGAPTGMMLKDRPRPDRSRVVYYRRGSAASRIEPRDLPVEVIRSAAVLHVTGINLAISAASAATTHAAVDLARDAGVLVSVDINHRARLWDAADTAAESYRALIAKADIVFAGDDEAALVTGTIDHGDQARALAALGPSEVVIKLGADGALAVRGGEVWRQPAFDVRVADTVGAGDAFVAGYLTELTAGRPVPRRLRTGAAAGALVCEMPGDWEGAPTRADLDALGQTGDPVQR
ncbi:sugar kinase [Microbacterium sp. SYP-A9085]|uniref:sugar kinase n=1 Tax=Microbacterium sp. SYP-A9085 TaxID=2664454 RepID=UPI00129AC3FD|nr:sugar kinase [Microbacterium sp. SYP-A9085]MRH30092.1 sugar kinase [Microbacterium sp. SYP-A9085]